MQPIKTVGIFSRAGIQKGESLVPGLLAWLEERGITIRYDRITAGYAGRADGLAHETVPEHCEFVIVLGGDGTLLSAASAIGARAIPLFAVNLGNLGFLTAITPEEMYPELERALRGEHRMGHRRMVQCTLERGGEKIASYLALNDVVVSKAASAPMIDLETHVDNHFVCNYRADGLIVSTPTGSTAYSLSAGGPIIFPTVQAFALTPICPHSLTFRPVIVPDSAIVKIISHAPDDSAYLNADGKMGEHLKRGDRLVLRRSSHTLNLIRPPRLLYFDVLRQKLKWGER
ncbi:MAG: NAD(+)/NADH kinase [Bryobacterales bacterium]|nr:NAD(+)/NADH kinase [Bryobacterales bacterium]